MIEEIEKYPGELKKLREENRHLKEVALKYLTELNISNPHKALEEDLADPKMTMNYYKWNDGK